MNATRDNYTKWSKSEREREIYYLHVESKMWRKLSLSTKQKHRTQTQRTDLWLPRGKQLGKERSGKLWLADLSFYENGWTTKSYCVVQRELYSIPYDNRGQTKPMGHSYWACALKPGNHNYWTYVSQLLKPHALEPMFHNRRSHCSEKLCTTIREQPPAHCN